MVKLLALHYVPSSRYSFDVMSWDSDSQTWRGFWMERMPADCEASCTYVFNLRGSEDGPRLASYGAAPMRPYLLFGGSRG